MPKSADVDLSEFAKVGTPKLTGGALAALTDEQVAKIVAAHEAGYIWPDIAKVVRGWGIHTSDSTLRRFMKDREEAFNGS